MWAKWLNSATISTELACVWVAFLYFQKGQSTLSYFTGKLIMLEEMDKIESFIWKLIETTRIKMKPSEN